MGITFTKAPTVAKGDPVISTQYRQLAAAFNDRLRSGLGDGAWRIVFYWLSLFRQARNPDESFTLFPPIAEFFTAGYQMLGANSLDAGEPSLSFNSQTGSATPPWTLDPSKRGMLGSSAAGAEWPVAGPGEPEGANLACQIMAYVFGAEAINLYDEPTRLTNPDPDAGGIALGPADTDADLWELAKQQRGGYDPDTFALGSPAWSAARSHYKIAMSARSPHGNAYGGYLPTPDLVEGEFCDDPDPDDGVPAPLNYLIKFTALKDSLEDKVYPGTCQAYDGNAYAGHVAYIGYTAWAYYVYKNDGSIDVLSTTDYVEGPYTGEARLRKTSNGALNRVLNSFAGEFRGSDTQRTAPKYWLGEAFDTQRFLTTQYHLAPNIGTESGDAITTVYPLFEFSGTGTILSGTLAVHVQSGSDHHAYHAGFALSSCLITAGNLSGSATLEFRDGSTLLKSQAFTADADGNVEKLVIFEPPMTPASLTIKLASDALFTAPGGISVECNEILVQKPSYEDLFLVLRVGGALSEGDSTDGTGINEERARIIGENYFAAACITNAHGATEIPASDGSVNTNAVFDAARRLSKCVRIIPRQNFIGYAVENGKSICWFTTKAQIGTTQVELFGDITPPVDYVAEFDFNTILRGATRHAYKGAAPDPTSLTPDQILALPAPVSGITTEDGAFITSEDGTNIRTEDQPT